MSHNIFLSYSRKDIAIMHRLRNDFRAADFTVWTDEGIEPGSPSWKSEIEKAIRECDCQVIVFSPDANNSRWVRAEIDFAETLNKPMFPVLARGDETTAIPFGFSTYQWIDIRKSSDYESGFHLLADAISNRLRHPQDIQPTQAREGAEPEVQHVSRLRSGWVAGIMVFFLSMALVVLILRPDSPETNAAVTDDTETASSTSTSAVDLSSPTRAESITLPSGTVVACKMLTETASYEQVNPPTMPIPDGWVQLKSDAVTIAVPREYYSRPVDANVLNAIFSSIFASVAPGVSEFACDWQMEIFFVQMLQLRGGGVVSRSVGVPLTLEAQRVYFEEAFRADAVVETEFVSMPAGDMVRFDVTMNSEGVDAKMIGYSISHGPTLYIVSFAFAADAEDEDLALVDQIVQTLRFTDEQ